jgi:hypothetical protein
MQSKALAILNVCAMHVFHFTSQTVVWLKMPRMLTRRSHSTFEGQQEQEEEKKRELQVRQFGRVPCCATFWWCLQAAIALYAFLRVVKFYHGKQP